MNHDTITYTSIDSKGRIILPSYTEERKSDKLVIESKDDLTFSIYTLDNYMVLINIYNQRAEKAIKQGDIKTYIECNNQVDKILLSRYSEIENDDEQGRILIPKYLRCKYKLEKKVLLCSVKNHIQVFKDEEVKEEYRKKLDAR